MESTKETETSLWEVYVSNNELTEDVVRDLETALESTRLVLLLDDSGSMVSKVVDPSNPLSKLSSPASAGPSPTRWSELEKAVSALLDLLLAAPRSEKLDIHFLNRGNSLAVVDKSVVAKLFHTGPKGGTPLCRQMQSLFDAYGPDKKKTLIIVVTDGEPTDGGDDQATSIASLFKVFNSGLALHDNVYVSFAECNDNEAEMAYLDGWDTKLPRFDNNDDYPMEAVRVKMRQKVMGQRQRFTYLDYMIKIILGAVDPKYFNMDQIPAIPPTVECEISKRGRFWKTWKKRLFSLSRGRITYSDADRNPPMVKGQLLDVSAHSYDDEKDHLYVVGQTDGTARTMALKFSNLEDRKSWGKALDRHIGWNELFEMRNELQNLQLELSRLDDEIEELTRWEGSRYVKKNPDLEAIARLQLQSLPPPKRAITMLGNLSERLQLHRDDPLVITFLALNEKLEFQEIKLKQMAAAERIRQKAAAADAAEQQRIQEEKVRQLVEYFKNETPDQRAAREKKDRDEREQRQKEREEQQRAEQQRLANESPAQRDARQREEREERQRRERSEAQQLQAEQQRAQQAEMQRKRREEW